MNRRDFTANTALQTTFINQGIQRIQRELRCPAMEKQLQITIPPNYVGWQGVTIPNDFLELIDIYDTSINIKMTKVDLSRALNGAQVQSNTPMVNGSPQIAGPPTVYCRQGGQWILAPSPASGSIIQVDYYCELAPLVNPTDTNTISIIAWDLIVYAALVQAGIYYNDPRRGTTPNPADPTKMVDGWEGQYNQILDSLQDQSDEDDENGAAVVMPCYVMPLDWEFEHY
jgi:hypothetical protein